MDASDWRAIGLMAIVMMVGVVIGAIVVFVTDWPSSSSLFNERASKAADNTRIAEAVFYNNVGSADCGGSYAFNLNELLSWDKTLTEDPQVTFIFGACGCSGYTFTTTHAHGDRAFVKTEPW